MSYKKRATWAEINIGNLKQNYKNIKKLLKEDTKICGVIKANAYGHGSVQIAKTLEEEGVDYLAIATLEEGIELRNNDIKSPILCLGYIQENCFDLAVEKDIDITIYKNESAQSLNKISKQKNKKARVHIKLDTGMSRLGFQINDESVDTIESICGYSNLDVVGIYSHFAMADEKDKTFTNRQFDKYTYIINKLENRGIKIPIKHICNSAGIMDCPEYHLDMVRSGIILYGHYPSEDVMKDRIDLKPVMTLKTTVSNIKTINPNTGISYGQKYIADDFAKIATVPIGYADGFTRMLNQNANMKIKDKLVPVVGRICMDQCMIRVDGLDVEIGDEVEIFGEDANTKIERLADSLNTINYEVLCMISRRIPRVYLEGNRVLHILDYLIK
ncbi:alanine racemase [Tepidibacter hydrothermalis]|uniref:Alanine racemase n=1 Tax=Tepidibacter hydrothermalis TaxID=3036126 RepID=A0ABY8EII1_9FIRM|nr:alanine racemase [Tepidibacter hydrothermalis]WFD10633.1 alanine racemase [Tepidibacter hydrothermalis]